MPDLTIYGTPASRAFRSLWMAKELGLEYDLDPVGHQNGESRTEAFRKINPNGQIPAIRDGDFVLWESLAINLYLAKKHGGPLAPAGLEMEMLAVQWSMWALTAVEHHAVCLLMDFVGPEEDRDPEERDRAKAALAKPLGVLDGVLGERPWLVGDNFSVADMNVASVMRALIRVGYDLAPYPKLDAWLDNCLGRPAAVEANQMAAKALAG